MTYMEKKNQIRNEAIDWQHNFPDQDYSWQDIAEWQDYFYRKGKRYGLLTEFRENGIC